MKKYNQKQLAYSQKKSRTYVNKMRRLLLLSVFIIIAIPSIVTFAQEPTLDNLEIIIGGAAGGATVATMAVIGDIAEVSDREAAPNQIGLKVYLIARDQMDGDAVQPLPNASRETGTLPMKTGETFHYFDSIDNSPNLTSTAEKGDLITTFTQNISFVMAGNPDKLLDYMEEYSGKGFIILYKECESTQWFQLGNYCKPMILQSSNLINNNEGKNITFTFQNSHWRQPLKYTGTLIRSNPVTVGADATTFAYDPTNNRYKLTDNTGATVLASVSNLTSNDIGRTFTIYAGDADTNATTIDEATGIVLKDGTTWTANVGSEITFQIFDTSTIVEVSRVQTA